MHSKVVLADTPLPAPKRRGRPRSISISEPPKEEPKAIEPIIPAVEPHVEISKSKRGRPKKVIV